MYGHDNKKSESCGMKYKYCEYYFEYASVKDKLIVYKYFCCNRN